MWLVELPAYTEDIPDEPSVVESNRMVSLRSCRRLGWYLGWLHEVGQKPISWLDFFGHLAEASFSLRKSNHFGASEGSQSGTTHHFACAMGSKWATWHFIGYKACEYGWQPPSITQSFFGSPRLLRIAYYIRFAHSLGPHFQPIWKLKVHCLVAQQLREFMSMSLRSSKLSGPIPSFVPSAACASPRHCMGNSDCAIGGYRDIGLGSSCVCESGGIMEGSNLHQRCCGKTLKLMMLMAMSALSQLGVFTNISWGLYHPNGNMSWGYSWCASDLMSLDILVIWSIHAIHATGV